MPFRCFDWLNPLLLGLAFLCLAPNSARAQGSGVPDLSETEELLTTVALGVTGLTGLGLIAMQLTAEDVDDDRQAIRLSLARGNGTFPSDLASHLGLAASDIPRVGAALRNARHELEPLLRATHPSSGTAFIAAAEKVLKRDGFLSPRIKASAGVGNSRQHN